MTVVRAGDVEEVGADGNHYAGLATPRRGATEIVLARARKDPGAASVAHAHDREEVIWVAAGRALAVLDGVEHRIGPGDTLIVPPGVVHQVRTLGTQPFECVLAKPAGIRFLDPAGVVMDTPGWMA